MASREPRILGAARDATHPPRRDPSLGSSVRSRESLLRNAMAQPRSSKTSAALPSDARIAAVVSLYHAEIGSRMLVSARRELEFSWLAPVIFLEVWAPVACVLQPIGSV